MPSNYLAHAWCDSLSRQRNVCPLSFASVLVAAASLVSCAEKKYDGSIIDRCGDVIVRSMMLSVSGLVP